MVNFFEKYIGVRNKKIGTVNRDLNRENNKKNDANPINGSKVILIAKNVVGLKTRTEKIFFSKNMIF